MGLWSVVFTLALCSGLLVSCGGSPDDAPKEDFCAAVDAVLDFDDFDEAQDAYNELKDVGTPEDIDDDARSGFEISVDAVLGADDEDEAREAYDDLGDDEKEQVEAFNDYAEETCAGEQEAPATPRQ
ncbi:hypothetical protein D0Z08_26200 [Nocardioides immobilis]|uniref:Lipoprotein n=1 Tax=Nocardioides immobilis TaxID=2049295 RepID=A0A417XUT0_9ACTN|nr:hypothetical protein [Nocardioides immobilis]RHW24045.1 hypothetical protein D0Z08_26200 [Nocardioides immobilis]